MQQNSRICFPSFHPPTTFLVPSFTVQMIFFIAPAGNKLKSEREGARSCHRCHCLARARAKPDAISKKLLNSIREMDRNGLGGIRSGGEGSGRSRFKGVEIGSLRHRPLFSLLPIWPIWGPRRGAAGIRVMITDVEKTANSSSGRRRRGCQCQRHGRDKPLINKPNNEWTAATAACGGGGDADKKGSLSMD